LSQFIYNANSAAQPFIILGKSRGTSTGSYTVVQDDDYLGAISFQGADGDEMVDGARIEAQVNGTPSNDTLPTDLLFKTNTGQSSPTERLRITEFGRVIIGTTDDTSHTFGYSWNPKLQLESNASADYCRFSLVYNGNDAVGPGLVFGKSRGTSIGSNTVVSSDDQIGGFYFQASDGTDKNCRAATIVCFSDGSSGANDTPGRLVFSTTADGASDSTERLRITSNGVKQIKNGNLNINSTYIDFSGDVSTPSTAAAIFRPADNTLAFSTANTERLRITSSGYVQIGQSLGTNTVGGQAVTGNDYDPIFKIYNNSGSKWLMQLRNDNSTNPNGIFMRAGNSNSNYTMYLTGNDEHQKHLIVTGNGNTGIGTDNPDEKLEVNGNAKFTRDGDVGGPAMGVFPLGNVTLVNNASATLNLGSRFSGIVIVAGNQNDTASAVFSDSATRLHFQTHNAANTTDLTISSPSHGGTHQFQLNQSGSATKTYKVIAFGIHGG
jgi:hypothetical protein